MKLINSELHIPDPGIVTAYHQSPEQLDQLDRAVAKAYLERCLKGTDDERFLDQFKSVAEQTPFSLEHSRKKNAKREQCEIKAGQIWQVNDYIPSVKQKDTYFVRANEHDEYMYTELFVVIAPEKPRYYTHNGKSESIVKAYPIYIRDVCIAFNEAKWVENYLYLGIPFIVIPEVEIDIRSDSLVLMLGCPKEKDISDYIYCPNLNDIQLGLRNKAWLRQEIEYINQSVEEIN